MGETFDNPSPGFVQGETVYDAIRAIMREPEMLVDVGYEGAIRKLGDTAVGRWSYPMQYLEKRYQIQS